MQKGSQEVLDMLRQAVGGYDLNDILLRTLAFFFKNPYESLTVVDTDMRIQYMDRASEKLFGLEQGGAKGIDIRKLVPSSAIPYVVETGLPITGRVLEVKGSKRIATVLPLKKDGKVIGGIGQVIFQSVEEIERVVAEMRKLERQLQYLKQRRYEDYSALYTFDHIIGKSLLINEAIETAKKVAFLDVDTLIYGESGTGKELFAHSIHGYANRDRPFVKVNCPAIPFDLAESELFGYEKGAFSGALPSGKLGKFAIANNGTIFLDEVSSLPLSIQAKLLRVLQEKEFEKLGGTKTEKVNFRLIAATNSDLRGMVKEGKFREDLYYRISKSVIRIPPLRERRADIPLYLAYYLEKVNRSFNTQIKSIAPKAQDIFTHYHWPGNVRELINFLEQAMLKASNSDVILPDHLPAELTSRHSESPRVSDLTDTGKSNASKLFRTEIEEKEQQMIVEAIRQTSGNRRRAAAMLNMPRSTFYTKIKKYNVG